MRMGCMRVAYTAPDLLHEYNSGRPLFAGSLHVEDRSAEVYYTPPRVGGGAPPKFCPEAFSPSHSTIPMEAC